MGMHDLQFAQVRSTTAEIFSMKSYISKQKQVYFLYLCIAFMSSLTLNPKWCLITKLCISFSCKMALRQAPGKQLVAGRCRRHHCNARLARTGTDRIRPNVSHNVFWRHDGVFCTT